MGTLGKVVGLEASLPLFAFASEGLPGCIDPAVSAAIDVDHADATEWLARCNEMFDLAMLDPMFPHPKRAEPGFELLRRHAIQRPLDDGLLGIALQRACTVVVKVANMASLATVSLEPTLVRRTRSAVWARFTNE